jgi:hypothetical protein
MGMRIASASSVNQGSAASGASAWQQRRQQFEALSKALQGGNLDAAKAAYGSLVSQGGKVTSADPNSPFAQLGKALQGGDLAGAQQAFAAIKSHRHQAAHGAGGSSLPAPSPPTATAGNRLNVVV